MFATVKDERLVASKAASNQIKSWEQLLALRINLQKPLDIANQLPVSSLIDDDTDSEIKHNLQDVQKTLRSTLHSMVRLLDSETEMKPLNSKDEITWDDILAPQEAMYDTWEPLIDRWHGRLNFGSEKVKAKLKLFNHSIWKQVMESLDDENRNIEKSRISWDESKRIGKNMDLLANGTNKRVFEESDEESEGFNQTKRQKKGGFLEIETKTDGKLKSFDLEVYDDRGFYSLLLKNFITSHSGSNGQNGFRPEDLAALRKYKSKNNVDRKASKGRKVKYTVHSKLQNFMFPVPFVPPANLDVAKLHESLFQ